MTINPCAFPTSTGRRIRTVLLALPLASMVPGDAALAAAIDYGRHAAADTAAARPASASADTARPAAADTAAAPSIVRRLEEFIVRGSRLHDPRSSETVHLISSRTLRALPVDRLADAVALKAGVVAQAGDLHVRGGRAGEMQVTLDGIVLNEPLRDRPPELPLLAVRSASLVSGGLDAEYGGALAGVLDVRTVDPGERWGGEVLWRMDGGGTNYDRVSARLGGPLGLLGLGAVASADITADDTNLPALRSDSGFDTPLGRLGWRADNRLLGHIKIAPVAGGGPALQVLASRRVDRPFDPIWSLDGFVTPCVFGDCVNGPGYSPTPLPGYEYYRGADHAVMTDERRVAAVLTYSLRRAGERASAAFGFTRARSLTSLDGNDDESYLVKTRAPYWGLYESPTSEPFLVYAGDEPYYRKSESEAWAMRADYERWTQRGNGGKAGLGGTYHAVRLRELDLANLAPGARLDSLRTYRAFAPGAFAYAQGRWVFEGMILNGGLRAEYFTAGPQAEAQSSGGPAGGVWSFSPRLGIAYPISERDVFSLAYVRIQQNPARDFLYDNRVRPNNYRPLGNTSIEPATVISWQAAVKHLIGELWSLQGSLFMRDVWGEVGARNTNPFSPLSIFRYEGVDDAYAIGWELSLIRARESGLNLEMHYTWLTANGSESLEEGIPYYLRSGPRPEPIGVHPLNWDRRHALSFAAWREWDQLSVAWSTQLGTGLPWTPATRRQLEGDLSRVNTGRFNGWESSALSLRWRPPWLRSRASIGLEVRNLFDSRGDTRTTLNGYPHFEINTAYDDYGAHRSETGQGGGAYWDDLTGDGYPGWVRMHDPRLATPPRTVRLEVGATW